MARQFDPIAFAKGVLRRATRKTKGYNECLSKVKRLEPMVKKDGTKGKKMLSWFKCAHCEGEFKRREINVDHIIPIVPVDAPIPEISDWIHRLYCDSSELQVLCITCHKVKSKAEAAARAKWRKENKK